MYYVYLIESDLFPQQRYIGYTAKHTLKYKPWKLISYHAFTTKRKAQEFEYYLKTGSGQAFAKKRFWCESSVANPL